VMEWTGPAGAYGQAGGKSVEMAFRDFNDAGGVNGCKLVTDTRDSQSQGNVAVDQATQLVNIKKVPVVIGGIISSISIPILTSVTAPAGVVQVSPASSSPTLTALGREGKTNGVFFRTITSDALQGTAAAKYAIDQGLKKIAIIHVNNDFGVNMVREFSRAYQALGNEERAQIFFDLIADAINDLELNALKKSLERVSHATNEARNRLLIDRERKVIIEPKIGEVHFERRFVLLEIFYLLASAPGKVFSKEDLVERTRIDVESFPPPRIRKRRYSPQRPLFATDRIA